MSFHRGSNSAKEKKISPRSVLDFFGLPAGRRINFAQEGSHTLSQSYVSFEDEDRTQYHGSKGKAFPDYDEKKKAKGSSKVHPITIKQPAYQPDIFDAVIDKIQLMSLRGLLDKVRTPRPTRASPSPPRTRTLTRSPSLPYLPRKATDAETCYLPPKEKHVDQIVKMVRDPARAKSVCEYYDAVLRHCSKGSLTRADYAIKIMKVCYVLHAIMKKGTAQAYKNVFGNYPDIFDLPQIALPKSIPSSCVEARMAVAYCAYLNTRVRLRQQECVRASATYPEETSTVLRMHGLDSVSVVDLFEKAMSCRFYRRRDFSTIFPRDTIQLFQFYVISDLLQHFEALEREWANPFRGGEDDEEEEEDVLAKRKQQFVSWAERMQASKHMCDGEYNRLAGIRREVQRAQEAAKRGEEEEKRAQERKAEASPFKPLPDLLDLS